MNLLNQISKSDLTFNGVHFFRRGNTFYVNANSFTDFNLAYAKFCQLSGWQDAPSQDEINLFPFLTQYFSMGELDGICFDNGIDDERTSNLDKDSKARDLIRIFASLDKIPQLKASILKRRPNLVGKI